jgi:hypothetical protein
MILWERQEDGGWQGFSGELLVATVTKDESAEREQWLWSITALKRPKAGAREPDTASARPFSKFIGRV